MHCFFIYQIGFLIYLRKKYPQEERINKVQLKTAVILPCHNEVVTIVDVINQFKFALPDAKIYVYDNNSTDGTGCAAAKAGATVCYEPMQGKGNVVRRMFADVEADIFVMADGDGTYDATIAPILIKTLCDRDLDMVVGARSHSSEDGQYRTGHQFGNKILTWFAGVIFGRQLKDMLSGYRVFSRKFVKSFPALSKGFEIETELTFHSLYLQLPILEVKTKYSARPDGSASKLSTWKDGLRILWTILLLFKDARPFLFFSALATLLVFISIFLSYPVFVEFIETGLVRRFPTAILSTGIIILAYTSFICGVLLDSLGRSRLEIKRLAYLLAERRSSKS